MIFSWNYNCNKIEIRSYVCVISICYWKYKLYNIFVSQYYWYFQTIYKNKTIKINNKFKNRNTMVMLIIIKIKKSDRKMIRKELSSYVI